MKNQPTHISKMQEKIKEINLAQDRITLAQPDYKKAEKISLDIFNKIVDLKGFANTISDIKLANILKQLDKAHSSLDIYLNSKS